MHPTHSTKCAYVERKSGRVLAPAHAAGRQLVYQQRQHARAADHQRELARGVLVG
jgi:hypothetical protein